MSRKVRTGYLWGSMLSLLFSCFASAEQATVAPPDASATVASVHVPLTVKLRCLDCIASKKAIHTAEIVVDVPKGRRSAVGELRVSLGTSGIIRVVGREAWVLTWDDAQSTRRLTVEFTIQGVGEGALTVTALELNGEKSPRWGPSDELFVLRTKDEMLTGKASTFELWHNLLKRDLARHRITQSEYKRKLRLLLERGKLELEAHFVLRT